MGGRVNPRGIIAQLEGGIFKNLFRHILSPRLNRIIQQPKTTHPP